MKRTHHCGELRAEQIEQSVTLCGWANVVRDQSYQLFIDLRDRHGLTQVVIDAAEAPEAHELATGVRNEFVLRIDGRVTHDMYLYQVKTPAESKGKYDDYKLLQTIPAAEAFRPLAEDNCPLVK